MAASKKSNAQAVDEQPVEDNASPDAARSADNATGKPAGNTPAGNTERRPVSQAVVRMNVSLRSRYAQRVFHRAYYTAARALYTLSVMLRIYATEAEAEAINRYADDMLATLRTELLAEIERMEKVAEDQAVAAEGIEYTAAEAIEVEVNSPRAGQFLGLIREMDRFIGLMDLLWLSGVYTDAQYSAGSYQWQRRIIKVANRLRNTAQRAMALARRSNDQAKHSLAAEMLGDAGGEDTGPIPEDDDEGEGEDSVVDGIEATEAPALNEPAAEGE